MYSRYSTKYRNVYKSNQINIQDGEALVIDNNDRVAEKIEHLEEQLIREAENPEAEDFPEGFLNGLDAEQVEALTADEAEIPPAVLKAQKEARAEKNAGAEKAAQTEKNVSAEKTAQAEGNAADTLSLVSAQAHEMLDVARREAESIKTEMLVEANQEIEELRRSALEEAKEQGYDEGYGKAMEDIEKQKEKLQEEHVRLEEEYRQMMDDLEPRFVETLTDIYEKVFQVDLKKEHNIVMHLLASTMHKIEGNSSYLIHVSKEDYSYVNMKKTEVLAATVSRNASVEIVEDVTLGPNDCIIETDSGVFDCGLGTQLEELSQKLRLLSYSGK